jgi:anti-sigma B factor antagonist
MKILESTKNNIHTLNLTGRLDTHTSPAFEKKLFACLKAGTLHVVIDCSDLEYISSAGLRAISKASEVFKSRQGELILCKLKDYIKDVFEISGLDSMISISNICEDANFSE